MKQLKKDLKEAKKTFETEQKNALKELKETAKNSTSAIGFEVAKEKVLSVVEEAFDEAMEGFDTAKMMKDMKGHMNTDFDIGDISAISKAMDALGFKPEPAKPTTSTTNTKPPMSGMKHLLNELGDSESMLFVQWKATQENN